MRLGLDGVFTLYVLVFLAGVLAAWFSALWAQRRTILKHRTTVTCRCCAARIPIGAARRRVRCPHCGARNALDFPPS